MIWLHPDLRIVWVRTEDGAIGRLPRLRAQVVGLLEELSAREPPEHTDRAE